ncbi:MAG: DUF6033 family protein [Clostridium sp.]|nr:DUF6033 family protein [Clostridium sp.]
MNMDIISPNYQSIRDRAKEDLKKIENKGVSKVETLEDLRDTKGKSFRTSDLEKLMEKYDPQAYAEYCGFAKSADGARTQGGLAFLSNWMDKVKKELNNGSISSGSHRDTIGKTVQTSSATKKTAADELSYLSKKYSNYSFVAANYTKGMQYGSSSTVNVAISPQFLSKMASDSELEKEYEKNIAAMQECDEQNARQVAAGGWHVVAQGWAIDKDGGISKWSIVQKDDAKSHLQTMSENAEKIRKQNEEKKQEKAKIEEKWQADREEKKKLQEKLDEAGKEQFGDKWKGVTVVDKADENAAVPKADKDNAAVMGLNMDIKA